MDKILLKSLSRVEGLYCLECNESGSEKAGSLIGSSCEVGVKFQLGTFRGILAFRRAPQSLSNPYVKGDDLIQS
jgi:hypothetical protein